MQYYAAGIWNAEPPLNPERPQRRPTSARLAIEWHLWSWSRREAHTATAVKDVKDMKK